MSFTLGFLLFDDLTQLDFTGPLQVLSRLPGAQTVLIAKTDGPVRTDCGPFILPTHTLETAPDLDLLCVPGGFGVDAVMQDEALLEFVRHQGERARYVTSVCTGAFILGAAGLLTGKRATTHWRYHDHLAAFGAIPVRQRVVHDGRVISGGGVTAGIDFAFSVVREIAGEAVASAIQLGLEYDPEPPLNAGHPDRASAEVRQAVEARFAPRMDGFEELVSRLTAQDG
ncbi:DJ-1/PfpI family protein [Oceanicaulis sp. LC35]|uniref:DJ-1/PfpI family protein n=1 Tax=Oceanicaulis sp. LC35 TaxID=3349635 RepID=UPI003F875CFD